MYFIQQNVSTLTKIYMVVDLHGFLYPNNETNCLGLLHSEFHLAGSIQRFVCDQSHRIRYETTGNRRGSWYMTEIGTLAILPLTRHD